MARQLSVDKENVLGKLLFYCAHGRPEDFDGKFKDQVLTHEKEVLSEIVGVLTLAASLSVKLQRGVLIATLEKVLLELFLIFEPTFHPAVAWCLAQFYQRKDEKPEPIGRTLWENGPPTSRVGGEGRAKDVLKLLHLPRSNFFEVVGRRGGHPTLPPMFSQKKLGDIFRRYNPKISRHSLDSSPHQIDGGPFFEFSKPF